MEMLAIFLVVWAFGHGVGTGSDAVKKDHKARSEAMDRTNTGAKVATGLVTGATAAQTFVKGFGQGWSEAWPVRREVMEARREARRTGQDPGAAQAQVINTARDLRGQVIAGTVVDPAAVPVPPAAPAPAPAAPPTAAPAAPAAPAAAAPTGGRPPLHVVKNPPEPPAAPTPAAPANPAPPVTAPAAPTTPPPAAPAAAPAPAATTGGTGTTTPAAAPASAPAQRSAPMAKPGAIEVNGVDSLIAWLLDAVNFANREADDATAAVRRIGGLEQRLDAVHAAALASKYDAKTLAEIASVREQLGGLRKSREEDAATGRDCAANCNTSASNVQKRHGAIQEAVGASTAPMAQTSTYGD
ncbi:hypothetical protein ABZW10_32985 [Kitasatospora sp. NPDC004723]|uniref:hypothetical protein n=1 Tax=Kitasatospora sp. NPDC004723 TaxID=3154288 RepID=UPI0033A909E2